ncbi:hypothetical protein SH467x_001375 [Pirellulaceae bacterium SH467]
MSWESRNGRGRYYTRSRRESGRVKREYIGTGEVAETLYRQDLLQLEIRLAEAKELKEEKAEHRVLEQSLTLLDDLVNCFTRGTLISAGYYQHHRSEWRKRDAS